MDTLNSEYAHISNGFVPGLVLPERYWHHRRAIS